MTTHPHPDDEDLYIGQCNSCENAFALTSHELVTAYPQLADVFLEGIPFVTNCEHCEGNVGFVLQEVVVHEARDWIVLPAAKGCADCGRDHDPSLPHDANSLLYQHTFYAAQIRAGQPGRWPTWNDAMAHCHPGVQESWIISLREHGVDI